MFLVAHASYMILSAHRGRGAAEMDALEAKHQELPSKIERHTFMARVFHWVMAIAMFVLLLTAFLPIVGVRFAWVWWHWMAGLVLTGSIIYHIIHATFFLDFWSIWVGPRDIGEFKAEMMRELGHDVPGPKPGKYPLGNRLYHLAILVTGLVVSITGILMMARIRTPFVARNPYMFTDNTWGVTYVLHGLMGVGLVGLVIAHVYFAVRPEKWWITKSMIFGTISRRQYLEFHEPSRWKVAGEKSQSAGRA
jgi:cytochrome b subunit of formate dehydrogenase